MNENYFFIIKTCVKVYNYNICILSSRTARLGGPGCFLCIAPTYEGRDGVNNCIGGSSNSRSFDLHANSTVNDTKHL